MNWFVVLILAGIAAAVAGEAVADRRGTSDLGGRAVRWFVFIGGCLALYLILARR